MEKIDGGAAVHVPNRGWFIFGGQHSTLMNVQQLESANGNWQSTGPVVFNSLNDQNQCVLQVLIFFKCSILCLNNIE